MIDRPIEIEEPNLSRAWGRAFLRARERPSANRLGPLVVSVTEFANGEAVEDQRIRSGVDRALTEANAHASQRGKRVYSVEECAFTIFPFWRWYRHANPTAQQLCDRYRRVLPRLQARDPRNLHGTYFERMIAFRGNDGETVDQLGKILEWWHRDRARGRSTRHSALQVACFDPAKDHTGSAQGGFPCLQQVSFSYDADTDGFSVAGYYPTQSIFHRAYGNYLGLCRLGQFMANQMGLTLHRMTCYVNHPLRDDVISRELNDLAALVQETLNEQSDDHGR